MRAIPALVPRLRPAVASAGRRAARAVLPAVGSSLALLLLLGCSSGSSGGSATLVGSVPSELSAGVDCDPCLSEPVGAWLHNPTGHDLAWLFDCTAHVERLADGEWVEQPNFIDCDCACPAWVPLPAGETLRDVAVTNGPGVYRVTFTVGADCSANPGAATAADCRDVERLVTPAFEVR